MAGQLKSSDNRKYIPFLYLYISMYVLYLAEVVFSFSHVTACFPYFLVFVKYCYSQYFIIITSSSAIKRRSRGVPW